MSSKKKTAVEWLIGDLNQKIDFIPMDKWDMIRDIIQQAKAMEKEQIGNAYVKGQSDCDMFTMESEVEQYYNSTYGQ